MVSEFAYDGLGNRYQSGVNGVTTTFSLDTASDLAQVLAGGDTLYYYGLERIAQQRTGGQPAYFLTDQLGSARHLVDAGGSILRSQSFDPFGNLLSASGSTLTSYGYAGEWHDPSGLLHLRARYYAPSQGRFLTRDPFPGLLSHPATQPPYPYALNNPLRYTDPSGNCPLCLVIGLGIAAAVWLANPQPVYAPPPGFVPPTNINPDYGDKAYFDTAPGTGDISDIYALLTGRTLFTQENVGGCERVLIGFASMVPGVTGGGILKIYQVGTFKNLKMLSQVGDGLALHHAPPKHAASQVLPGYNEDIGPAIALSDFEHWRINLSNYKGDYSGTPIELFEETLNVLATYTSVTPESLSALQALWREMWPNSFR